MRDWGSMPQVEYGIQDVKRDKRSEVGDYRESGESQRSTETSFTETLMRPSSIQHVIYQCLVVGFLSLTCASSSAVELSSLIGRFSFPEQPGLVEFYTKNGTYFGKIVDLPDSEATDSNNQDESMRKRRLVGIDMFTDLTFNANSGRWEDGTLYDARSGRTYRCWVWFEKGSDDLSVRGFIGTPLMGQTQVFPRATK